MASASTSDPSESNANEISPKLLADHRLKKEDLRDPAISSSEFTATPLKHKWTIRNKETVAGNDWLPNLRSANFSAPNSNVKWWIQLDKHEKYRGVFLLRLYLDPNDAGVKAIVGVHLIDQRGYKPTSSWKPTQANGKGWFYEEQFHKSDLIPDSGDWVTIECEIIQFESIDTTMDFQARSRDAEAEDYTLPKDLGRYFLHDRDREITLISKDNMHILAHRFILKARSSVFRAMLDSDMKERRTNTINLDDIEGEVISEMVNFLYTDTINRMETFAEKLLLVADRFDLIKLKFLCQEHLIKLIQKETVAHLVSMADMSNALKLKRSCLAFMSAGYKCS